MERNVLLDPDAITVPVRATRASASIPGAIGKGYALERALDLLREAGIQNALLHGGTSTVGALGAPAPGAPGWTVAVQHPKRSDAHLTSVTLRDGQAFECFRRSRKIVPCGGKTLRARH
jgi:thiamine biosynthesis lipoprotein